MQNPGERSQLLPKETEWVKRYRNTSKCITSKAGLISLIWSFAVATIYGMAYQPANFAFTFPVIEVVVLPTFFASAVILCFYPLAGFLADNKFGRYKTIMKSLKVLFGCLLFGVIAIIPSLYVMLFADSALIGGLVVATLSAVILFIPMTVGFVGFNANIIQFGMDQLHDSAADHQSLYIYWYVSICYLAEVVIRFDWLFLGSSPFIGILLLSLILVTMLLLVIVLLIVVRYKSHWFIIDPARDNPYRLVYEVKKFSWRHKVPLHRSAFTYCEEDLPTGLDLGKSKYGGPFTTEKVEDVKAFFGILKILTALGPVYFLMFALDPTLFWYTSSLNFDVVVGDNFSFFSEPSFFSTALSQNSFHAPVVVVILFIYIYVLHPFNIFSFPRMLKRMAIGIFFIIISLLCVFGLVTASFPRNGPDTCIFFDDIPNERSGWKIAVVLFVQCCCMPVSNVFIYTALYEFICAQSPHSMKGLLIGLSFAIKGLFQMFAVAMIIPFNYVHFPFMSCGSYYYMINVLLGLMTILVFICVARSYKYRQRGDFCDIYRYAEEYYSKNTKL